MQPAGSRDAPLDEPVACQGPTGQHPTSQVDSVYLDHALGEIDAHAHRFTARLSSCNLLHGLPPSMA